MKTNMTDDQIFEMLKGKLKKNQIKTDAPTVLRAETNGNIEYINYSVMLKEAAVLCYKIGYGRAIKGKPFDLNEKIENENSNCNTVFKVGDRVRMKKEHENKNFIGSYYPHAGICGNIVENDGTDFRVRWDSGVEESTYDGWWIEPEYLERVL